MAAAGVGAEHGEPLDGPRRPLPVRAAGTGRGEMRFIQTTIDEITSNPAMLASVGGA
jgi:hypothetical protein